MSCGPEGTTWPFLLDSVASGRQRLVLETEQGARVVLVAEAELAQIEARAGLRPRAEGRDDCVVLTPREREVLELVAQGLPGADIGARLGMATNTVDQHLAAVRRKYGVRTSIAAVPPARASGQIAQ